MFSPFQAEGIFRINPENSHEEHVREQLNKGIVPPDIDIHALAGLIKVSDFHFRHASRELWHVFLVNTLTLSCLHFTVLNSV